LTQGASACDIYGVNRIPLAGDVVERPIAYAGSDRVCRALAIDPALRSLPSPEVARRLGTTRAHVEHAIHGLVLHYTGHRLQPSGRSFDEAIADAGSARRAALSPEPLNEAAGFATARSGAGASAAERFAMRRPMYTRTGRRVYSFDAGGYQTPPIPDLAAILLSDAFPVTRRSWSRGIAPTPEEVAILNWQHPLVTGASSTQSLATLKAISQGCRSWDQPVTVAGNQLSPRSADERGKWWLELQQIMTDVSTRNVQGVVVDFPLMGQWGLLPPHITDTEVDLQYWDLSDASHPRLKMVMWMTKALMTLGSSASILSGTWGKEGAHLQIYVDGGVTKFQPNEGGDLERDSMKLFAGLGGVISSLTTAIASAVAVYCPACAVAIKIAGSLATNAANGAVTTKALASYGDQMLTDAAIKAAKGQSGSLTALRGFASALIGLPASATQGAQPNGGLVYDYLGMLGSAKGNVAWALQTYAQDHTNRIANAAQLATAAGVPMIDAQYAVAAMTDTLSRFASNVSTVYLDPNMSAADRLLRTNRHLMQSHLVNPSLSNLPMIPTNPPAMSGAETAAVAAGAIGLAWAAGLLKGLI